MATSLRWVRVLREKEEGGDEAGWKPLCKNVCICLEKLIYGLKAL